MPTVIGPADTILVNGRITTGVGDESEATALAWRDGYVVAVGSDADVLAFRSDRTEVVEVEGRRIIPGLIDSHIHMVRAGLTWHTEARWDGLATLVDALAAISRKAALRGENEWVRVLGGWAPGQFDEGRGPTRAELDVAAPLNPVYVQNLYEDAVLNTMALERTGLDKPATRPSGIDVETDAATGELTGRVRGKAALDLCTRLVGRPNLDQQISSTRAVLEELAAYGITGVADPNGFGVTPDSYRALYELWRREKLTVRTRLYLGPSGPGTEVADYGDWSRFAHPGFGDGMLRVIGFGEAASYGCMDLEGLDRDYRSTEVAKEEILQISQLAIEFGWPMHLHAILDESISTILDVWEVIDAETTLGDKRFSLCHADHIGTSNLARAASMGIGIAVQNRLVYRNADSARAWGESVVHRAPPLRDMLDAGIHVGAGTDSTVVSSPNPWLSIWWLISGGTLDGSPARTKEQRLTRAEALRLYTLGSAWFSFEEAERGSLAVGMLADLAVLSDDLFEIEEKDIPRITALLTIVGGRVVHATGQFATLR